MSPTEGFCRRGRGSYATKSFHVEGPKTGKAEEPTVGSQVVTRNLELRVSEAERRVPEGV